MGVESRRWMLDLLSFYRANMPGFADAWIMETAPQIGVRHSRRLTGVQPVLREQWQSGVVYADEIGVSPSLSPTFASVSVPFGTMVPVELDGLLAPGRHVASDAVSHTFLREIPQCWLTGQAAGVATALSVNAGLPPRHVDVDALQGELVKQGVYLRRRSDGPDLRLDVHKRHEGRHLVLVADVLRAERLQHELFFTPDAQQEYAAGHQQRDHEPTEPDDQHGAEQHSENT